MSRPINNPYLPDIQELCRQGLSPEHPANEQPRLTPLQSVAYQSLLWFFDTMRARASGRSYVMAHVIIELAKRGQEVGVVDHSEMLNDDGRSARYSRTRGYLVDMIFRVAKEHYPRDIFEYNSMRNTLVYKGRRPQ